MTLPCEKTRALENVRKFLSSLLDPKKTPRVPRWIRKEASYQLKHFPTGYDIDQIRLGWADQVFEKEEF